MRRVAYSTAVPRAIMKAQSLACASSSSRSAWTSVRRQAARAVGRRAAQPDETLAGRVEAWIDPVVRRAQPDGLVSAPSPGAGGRRRQLERRAAIEIVRQRDGLHVRGDGERAQHRVQPVQALRTTSARRARRRTDRRRWAAGPWRGGAVRAAPGGTATKSAAWTATRSRARPARRAPSSAPAR